MTNNNLLFNIKFVGGKEPRSNGGRKSKVCYTPAYPLLRDFSLPIDFITKGGWGSRKYIGKQPSVEADTSSRMLIQQLNIFPEAKDYLIGNLRQIKKILKELTIQDQLYRYKIKRFIPQERQEWWNDIIDGCYTGPDINCANLLIKKLTFVLADKPQPNSGSLNIEKAKQFPITDLLDFTRGQTKCIFHDDKNPSLTYYPKTNTVFCFSCNNYGDSIKVYQTLHNSNFVEAVRALQ